MQSPLLSHSFCQHQQPFLTYFRDSETGVRRLGFYPRRPRASWVTPGKSRPLFACIFLSDKQSLNKIYFVIWRGFFNINQNYIYMVLKLFLFHYKTKSDVNTSPADRVYRLPWELSPIFSFKKVLMTAVEKGLQCWKWPRSSHMPAEVSRFCFHSLLFHHTLFTKLEETQKTLLEI